jgi:hypothetical protein
MSTTRSRGSEVRYASLRVLSTCRIMTTSPCGGQPCCASRVSMPTMRKFSGPLTSAPAGGVGLGLGLGDADGAGESLGPNRSAWGMAPSTRDWVYLTAA